MDALQGHRVIDVACGSGDAQTLCLTDDDMVWSWGDGDYGKLGRGGSDGCKTPMKVRQFFSGGHKRHDLKPLFCHVISEMLMLQQGEKENAFFSFQYFQHHYYSVSTLSA